MPFEGRYCTELPLLPNSILDTGLYPEPPMMPPKPLFEDVPYSQRVCHHAKGFLEQENKILFIKSVE